MNTYINVRTIAYLFVGFIAAFVLLTLTINSSASAANVTWDGEGADSNFSTAANWSGDTVPSNGDVLIFDKSSLVVNTTLANDITGLSLGGITSTGSSSYDYTLTGNGIMLIGDIQADGSIALSFTRIDAGSDITISGSSSVTFGVFGGSGVVNLAGNSLNALAANVYIRAPITAADNITVGPNTNLQLTKNNSIGTIAVNGTLSLFDINALGAADVVVDGVNATAVFYQEYDNRTVPNNFVLNGSDTVGSLQSWLGDIGYGGGVVTFTGEMNLQKDVYFDTHSAGAAINGNIIGGYTISKLAGDTGTLTIGASNPSTSKETIYSDVQAGTSITVPNNEIAIISEGAERGAAQVNGGVLKGIGKVGELRLVSGTLAPGLSPGILNTGNLVLTGGVTEIEIGGTTAGNGDGNHDQLNVTGTVDLGSATTLDVTHWNDFRPALNDEFIIINNDGGDAVVGTFQGLADGATITVDGAVYTISYDGGDGNDVALVATDVGSTEAAPDTGFAMLSSTIALTLASIFAIATLGFVAKMKTAKN